MMNCNEYMQIEIENGSEEKVVNVKNIVKVDEDYEVALLDIMYDYTPFSLNQLTVSKSASRKETVDLTLEVNVQEDGLRGTTARRDLLSSKYNTTTRVQLSEFDIWNYEVPITDRTAANIHIDNVYKSGKRNSIDINSVVQLLNEGIESNTDAIKRILRLIYKTTNGHDKITSDRYFTLPKFEIDKNRNLIYLHLPYYVYSVELSSWLSNLTNLPKVTKKKDIPLSYAPLSNAAAEYSMLDPISRLAGNLNVVENQYRHDGVTIFVYCDLSEYQIVGSINSPLLRLTSLDRSKKGINWKQFTELQYMPLKYHQFHNCTISVRGEKGNPITSGKIYLTLHFRKRE